MNENWKECNTGSPKVAHTTIPYKYILNGENTVESMYLMQKCTNLNIVPKKQLKKKMIMASDWEAKSNLWTGSYLERHRN